MRRSIIVGLTLSGIVLFVCSFIQAGFTLGGLRWAVSDLLDTFPLIAVCIVIVSKLRTPNSAIMLISKICAVLGIFASIVLATSSVYLSMEFSKSSELANIVATNTIGYSLQTVARHTIIAFLLALAFLPTATIPFSSKETFG